MSTPTPAPGTTEKLPQYILLTLATLLNGYFFFLGTVCVRLWFYKGSLGPEPEKFVVLRKDLKDQYRDSLFPGAEGNVDTSTDRDMDMAAGGKGALVLDASAFLPLPKIGVHNVDEFEDLRDEGVRKYVEEERRISRLPAFEQDDCGDGTAFPNIPVADAPVEPLNPLTTALNHTAAHTTLGLTPLPPPSWLLIDSTYIPQHALRASLLSTERVECIQSTTDGDAACEELLDEVVEFLTTTYPEHFRVKTKRIRRFVRNETSGEEFALRRPWDVQPLEVLARLGVGDWCVWGKGGFTGGWYLQASATVFPAGWHMRKHIGKSLDLIINNMNEPMPMWEELPDIFALPALTPYTFTPTLLSRSTTYIQTLPSTSVPSLPTLHIRRPVDFFTGALQNLLPSSLIVRTETTSFRLLPRTGAIVMNTQTSTKKLTDVVGSEKKELLAEVQGWGEDEARFKGRDLWITSLRGWCLGRPAFRDDRTV